MQYLIQVKEAGKAGKESLWSLMHDELSIKEDIEWDGHRFLGYVDVGDGVYSDDTPLAGHALVFMVVSIDGSCKVPIGYFLIAGMSGSERANLVKICLRKLHGIGVKVVSLTCDGPSCHFTMNNELGACMQPENLKSYFSHPCENERCVYVFLNICHMLKLVRNTLGDGFVLYDDEGRKITWEYVVRLQELQELEGLRLANKLRACHIQWRQQKMKVNLAAQAISKSTADSVEYLNKILGYKEFEDSEGTVKFFRVIDGLFDFSNSKNPFAKGLKAPLTVENRHIWEPFVDEAAAYIRGLTVEGGKSILKTKRKTGFIGFLLGIESIKAIFNEYVAAPQAPLKYLRTYKFSQDHLELFFAAVRAAGGSNNNPTARVFVAIYKRLLMRSSIGGGKGNCVPQDNTSLLHVFDEICVQENKVLTITDVSIRKKYGLDDKPPLQIEDEFCDVPDITVNLSEFQGAVIPYIAGYVGRTLDRQMECGECCEALGSKAHTTSSSFIRFKDKGGLFKPSKDVIKICEETEVRFLRMLRCTNGKLPQGM